MASLVNNNNETTNTDNFITWYNSQKKGQDEEGSIISAQIIAQYLETMNFPNNDSGLIIITECLKKIIYGVLGKRVRVGYWGIGGEGGGFRPTPRRKFPNPPR